MNRKKATELWPIIKAFSEGRAMPKEVKLPEVFDIQTWSVGTLLRYARM